MTSPSYGRVSLKDLRPSEGNRNLSGEQNLLRLIPLQASTSDQLSQGQSGMSPETDNLTHLDEDQTPRGAESNVRTSSIFFSLSTTHNVL